MAGNAIGGKKAAAKNLANNPNFYIEIGKRGGSAPAKAPKGFAANPELAKVAGAIGGRSKRNKEVK